MNHQREGSISNAHVGRAFEEAVLQYLLANEFDVYDNITIPIGIEGKRKKPKQFDLGSHENKIIIECKANTWSVTDKVPVGKLTRWNYEMFMFFLAPEEYKKIFIVQRDYSQKRRMTLAEYYIDKNLHLIPNDVEIHEFDIKNKEMKRLL